MTDIIVPLYATIGSSEPPLGTITMNTLANPRTAMLALVSLLAAPLAHAASPVGPTTPETLAAAPTAPGAITLSWNASSSLVGVTEYRVYHVDADGNMTPLADVAPDQLAFTESGLAPGATVTYAVTALDLLGESAPSAPASATTWSVASAPTDLALTSGPGAVGEAMLTWGAPASDGGSAVAAYDVYRDGALVATVGASTLTFTDAGLTPFHAYAYEVAAVNAVGEGERAGACGVASPWVAQLGCSGVL